MYNKTDATQPYDKAKHRIIYCICEEQVINQSLESYLIDIITTELLLKNARGLTIVNTKI